jgi:hypothetical protein
MNNCSYGGSIKSVGMSAEVKMHYLRGDVTGKRGALGDDVNKGLILFIQMMRHVVFLTNYLPSVYYRRREGVLPSLADQHDEFVSLRRRV